MRKATSVATTAIYTARLHRNVQHVLVEQLMDNVHELTAPVSQINECKENYRSCVDDEDKHGKTRRVFKSICDKVVSK